MLLKRLYEGKKVHASIKTAEIIIHIFVQVWVDEFVHIYIELYFLPCFDSTKDCNDSKGNNNNKILTDFQPCDETCVQFRDHLKSKKILLK